MKNKRIITALLCMLVLLISAIPVSAFPGDMEGPAITDVSSEPTYPITSDEVNICAAITDVSGVADYPQLHVVADGFSGSLNMISQGEGIYCRDLSQGTMDPVDGMVVMYHVFAIDGEGNPSESGPYSFTYDGAAPVASFECTPTQGDESLEVTCTSTSTDTVDLNLDHEWTFEGSDTPSSTKSKETVTYVNDGVYTVALTVTDNAGHSDTTTTTLDGIVVLDVGPAAAFSATPSSGDEPLSVQFTDDSTSHDALVSWAWDFGDGETSAEEDPLHTYQDSNVEGYVVSLKVCDVDENCATATQTVDVYNLPPAVDAGEYSCNEGETISLSATATDVPADHPLNYFWDLDQVEGYETENQSVSYTCGNGDNAVSVKAQVTDNDGESGYDSAFIVINNLPPTADANGPYETAVDMEVCFTGSASDAYDEGFSYSWDFNYNEGFNADGDAQTSCTTYSEPGTYMVALVVNDGEDNSEVATAAVTVYEYGIELNAGQNLISIPLVPEDRSVEAVLNGVNPEVVWAYKYNPETEQNEWFYHPGDDAPEGVGNLDEMVPGYGYYVLMGENSDVLFNNGEKYYQLGNGVPLPPQVTLMPGWNLIGHYGLSTVEKSLEMQDLAGGVLTDLADVTLLNEEAVPTLYLTPNEGYWAFVTGQSNVLYAPSGADYDEYNVD